MFEPLLCFLTEVPSWLNQEHCALLSLSLFPLSHSPTVCIIKVTRMKLTFVGHCSHFEDVCKTQAGCKGSWNYAQVSGQVWGLIIQWLLWKWLNYCRGVGFYLVFLRGPPESSLDSDRPSAIHHHAVYSYKTNERLTL